MMLQRVGRFIGLGLGLALAASCSAKKAEMGSASPEGARDVSTQRAQPEAQADGEKRGVQMPADDALEMRADIDALEAELGDQEDALQAMGVVVDPSRDATPAATEDDDGDRCERICELSKSICTLQDRICALAEDHADAPRYAATCARAQRDCERASDACSDCS